MDPKETTQQRISKRAAEWLQRNKRWGESLAETLDRVIFEKKEAK